MLKLLVTIPVIVSFCACENVHKQYICIDYADTITVRYNKKPVHLSNAERLYYGEIIPYVANDHLEENLINQYNENISAAKSGDFEKCAKFVCADFIKKYLKNKFNYDFSEHEIALELAKTNGQLMKNVSEIGMDLIISRLVRKIIDGENICIVYQPAGKWKEEMQYVYTLPKEELAISTDSGKVWTFIAISDETPEILSLCFQSETIKDILDYNKKE